MIVFSTRLIPLLLCLIPSWSLGAVHNPAISSQNVILLANPPSGSPAVTLNISWPYEEDESAPDSGTLTVTIESGDDKIDFVGSENGDPTASSRSWESPFPSTFQIRATAPSSSVDDVVLNIRHDSGPIGSKMLTVAKIELKDVSFSADSGSNYIELKSDDLLTTYSAPHWQDNSTPANGTVEDSGDRKYPFAYIRNTKPKIAANFKVTPSGISNPFTVEASGPTGFKVNAGTAATVSGDTLTLAAQVSDETVPNEIKFHNAASIEWKVAIDGGTPVVVGSTTHRIYVVWATPTTSLRQETVFYVGCKSADGISVNTAAVADAINSDFTDQQVYRVNTTAEMTYWGGTTPAQEVGGLLEVGDGSCKAWSELWCAMLGAQGIAASVVNITPKNGEYGFLVKNWSFGSSAAAGGGTSDYPYLVGAVGTGAWDTVGIGAQGNPDPDSGFVNHFIVEFGVAFYDPSYGTPKILGSDREKTYEDAAFDGFLKEVYDWLFFNRRVCARKNDVTGTSSVDVNFGGN